MSFVFGMAGALIVVPGAAVLGGARSAQTFASGLPLC